MLIVTIVVAGSLCIMSNLNDDIRLRDDEKKILRTRPALSGRKVAIITGE